MFFFALFIASQAILIEAEESSKLISQGKPIIASSLYPPFHPSNCVDGRIVTSCRTEAATATNPEYFSIDLAANFLIDFVQVAISKLWSHFFQNVNIYLHTDPIFSYANSILCDSVTAEPVWQTYNGYNLHNFTACTNIVARYVRIQIVGLHNEAYLYMQEAMVFGRG